MGFIQKLADWYTKRKVGKIIMGAAAAGTGATAAEIAFETFFNTSQPAVAINLEAELMQGTDPNTGASSLTLDTKACGKIIAGLNYFLRNRTTMGLEENTVDGSFTFIDLNYSLFGGFAPLVAVKAVPGQEIMPRGGFQYGHKFGDNLSTFIMVTYDLDEGKKTDVLVNIGYNLPIRNRWGARFGWEEVMTFENGGTTTDTSRVRLGGTYKVPDSKRIISAGAAVDIDDIAGRGERVVTPGAYASVKF